MLTGIEIAAAAWGIISGVTTCSKYAKEYYDKFKQKRRTGDVLTRAEALLKSLDGSQLELGTEYGRLNRLGKVYGYRNGEYEVEHVIVHLLTLPSIV